MKTLLITIDNLSNTGGVSHYYHHLAKFWPGNDLRVIDNEKNELLANRRFFKWWRSFGIIKKEIKENQIDWLIVGQILPLGTVAYFLSLFSFLFFSSSSLFSSFSSSSFKYCLVFHGMDLSLAFKGRKKFLSRMIINRANKIVCANNYTADKLREINPLWAEKIEVVNPGISPDDEQIIDSLSKKQEENNENQKTDGFKLLSVGRLVKRKGIDKTILALSILEKECADKPWFLSFTYNIIGAGPDEEYLKNIIASLSPDLQKKISFLGLVSEQKKWDLLNDCSVFIMPSRDIAGDFEGFGIVYLEAGLSNKPVIAGRAGGVSDAVIDGETGFLLDPENLEDIARAIKTLAEDIPLANKMGEQGRINAQSFFWNIQAEKFYNFLLK